MAIDHNQAADNSLSLLKMFLGLFALTYLLWYMGGGPARWESRFEHITKQDVMENVVGKGVFLIEGNSNQ